MTKQDLTTKASEPTASLTHGMSEGLLNSGLLGLVSTLSQEDKTRLIRYIRQTEATGLEAWEEMDDPLPPYSMKELNARIDETEEEIDRGEGKTFDEMMDGFRQQLLWLK